MGEHLHRSSGEKDEIKGSDLCRLCIASLTEFIFALVLLCLEGLVAFCFVWFGLVCFGLVWFGLVWFGLVWGFFVLCCVVLCCCGCSCFVLFCFPSRF